jgi:ankyrin repeat protein
MGNTDGNTPLHEVARHGYERAMRVLLENGADIEARNGDGGRALDIAVETPYAGVVQTLPEYGAGIGVKDENCNTALHRASRCEQDIFEYRT